MDRQETTSVASVTADSFNLLLNALSRGERDPATEYERLRSKLGRFFLVHLVVPAEDLADLVFDRVAAKLGEGERLDLTTDRYFFAVARFVLLEHRRARLNRAISLDDEKNQFEPIFDPGEEARRIKERIRKEIGLEAVADCRNRLSAEEKEILDTYNGGSGREKIERRTALAAKLGKTKDTLIVAVSRINTKIKNCLKQKLDANAFFAAA